MPQVVIVGGGFAGPVLALCLKKHKISSAVCESRPAGYEHGGNIALAPNALRVLDHIGVYDQVGGPRRIFEWKPKSILFDALRIHRTVVHEALLAELKYQGIPVYYNKKCKGIMAETDSSATVSFEDGETVTSDFIVGTDGIHSRIRSHIFPQSSPSFSGLMGVMGCIMAKDLGDVGAGLDLPCMLFGATGSFAIMPSSFTGDGLGYFATIESNDRSRPSWAELEENKDELFKLLKERFLGPQSKWPAMVKALCEKSPLPSLTSWPFYSVPHLDSFYSSKKRVLIIGDAAHAIPPTGGQGAAMALEDAETLAYALAKCYAETAPSSPEVTIPVWQSHRNARMAKVIDFTSKNGTLRKSSPHAYEQVAKEWLIWAVFRWMGAEGGAQWMYGYNAESILSELP